MHTCISYYRMYLPASKIQESNFFPRGISGGSRLDNREDHSSNQATNYSTTVIHHHYRNAARCQGAGNYVYYIIFIRLILVSAEFSSNSPKVREASRAFDRRVLKRSSSFRTPHICSSQLFVRLLLLTDRIYCCQPKICTQL